MGRKHKHSKDKLHQTVTELTSHHVGANRELELSVLHRRLKFDSCCLSLDTVTTKPMGLCDQSGYCYVFECDNVVKFLEKFRVHPVSGHKVTTKDLFELKFHKNKEGQYHCPVICKLFNQHTKIVANRKTGHVYSFEAVQQLNLKPNFLRDLLTDEPFETIDDIVTIQDPSQADLKWNVSEFHYVKNKLKIDDDTSDSNIRDLDKSSILKSTLEEYQKKAGEIGETYKRIVGGPVRDNADEELNKINSAIYSDGALSSSITSTVMPVVNQQRAARLNEEQILYPRIKKKGYAQLMTNFGPINLELFCDRTPKTCHNFLILITRGYYDDTPFHRLIKNFILQGGDPTGSGSGGQSAWGEPFQDECHGDLKHEGRGVLAMANSGPNTNKSQFYITLRGVWDHLDGKHTVFGRVVGGLETLDRIESEIETDRNDRPKKELKIVRAFKYVDPFEDVQKALAEECRAEAEARSKRLGATNDQAKAGAKKKFRSGVGAYINLDQLQASCGETKLARLAKVGDEQQKRLKLERSKQQQQLDEMSDGQTESGIVDSDPGNNSLSGKLAALSEKRTGGPRISSYGNFSNW